MELFTVENSSLFTQHVFQLPNDSLREEDNPKPNKIVGFSNSGNIVKNQWLVSKDSSKVIELTPLVHIEIIFS